MSPTGTYSIGELADLADVTPRTIRYYVSQGLLASPSGAGAGARYDDDHLHRLRLIRRLQAEHLPLAEIRRRLEGLTGVEIEDLIARPTDRPADSALDYLDRVLSASGPDASGRGDQPRAFFALAMPTPPTSQPVLARMVEPPARPVTREAPIAPERSQWERIQLGPDVELHVRRPLSRPQNKRIERLVELACELLQEDTP